MAQIGASPILFGELAIDTKFPSCPRIVWIAMDVVEKFGLSLDDRPVGCEPSLDPGGHRRTVPPAGATASCTPAQDPSDGEPEA